MKRRITSICFCVICCTSFAQIDQSLSYDDLQTRAIELTGKANIDSAIILMEYAVNNFPEEEQWSTQFLAQLYTRAGKKTEALSIWVEGMGKGYNYHLRSPAYGRYFEDNEDFLRLRNKEKTRLDTSHIVHEVILPTNYNSENYYPVVFIFHGNNRNLEKSKINWLSQTMKDDYISVFLQSYIYSNDINYVWVLNDIKIEKEFMDIYDNILTSYSIDTSKIILSGMSAGGMLALELAFSEFIPVSGLVLNCPVVPESIDKELIAHFVANNRRIGIISGETDFALTDQKELIKSIKEQGGQSKITINKEVGHEFAEGFSDLLNEYLKWILE